MQEHFELVLVLIIAISVVPAAVGAIKGWQAKRRKAKASGRHFSEEGGAPDASPAAETPADSDAR